MGLSMRRQTNGRKKTDLVIAQRHKGRLQALQLLQTTSFSLRKISSSTGVTKSTVGQLKEMLRVKEEEGLEMLIQAGRVGVGTVLTAEEEKMILQRICFCARRGFVITNEDIKRIMARIAADGRKGWRTGVPSNDAVRSFRARHRDITYRKVESKEGAKLRAENRDHVQTFFTTLQNIDKRHPGLLKDPDRIWNVDETAIDATEARSEKGYCSSVGNHGGYSAITSKSGLNEHIPAAVAVSASGRKAPPFFIVAGQRVMKSLTEPLLHLQDRSKDRKEFSICDKYYSEGWFPRNGVIKMTENGSMEMNILPSLMKHIDRAVRAIIPAGMSYLLTLDVHSSRNGIEWIELCQANNCEVIVSPANTSHFLQPCDQEVDKRFKSAIEEFSRQIIRDFTLDTKGVGVNLASGVHAFESITPRDISKAFNETGIYPFDANFPQRFMPRTPVSESLADEELERMKHATVASRLSSVRRRNSDKERFAEAVRILGQSTGPSQALQKLSMLLQTSETVNDILMSSESKVSGNREGSMRASREILESGAPAECVTVGDMFEKRKQKEAEELQKLHEKEQEKLQRQQ